MAAFDKTYITTWKDYCDIVDWCKHNEFTCPNGMKIKFYPCHDELKEEDFDGINEFAILNTTREEDYFLIKYCPVYAIQKRMAEKYRPEYINEVINGTSPYDTFVRPPKISKIKLIKKPQNYHPLIYWNTYKKRWVQDKYSIRIKLPEQHNGRSWVWYNEKHEQWVLPNELGVFNVNLAVLKCKSWKALIRKIRTWHLPVGSIIKVHHLRLIGGYCEFIVTK